MVFQRNGRTTFIIRTLRVIAGSLGIVLSIPIAVLFSRCKEVKNECTYYTCWDFAISVLFVGGTQGMYIL